VDKASRTRDGFWSALPLQEQGSPRCTEPAAGQTTANTGSSVPPPPLTLTTVGGQTQQAIPLPNPALIYQQQQSYAAIGPALAQYLSGIRAQFPSLADMPDSLLACQPIDTLCRLAREEKAAEGKVAKNLEQRAHQNMARAAANPEKVHQGIDNRTTILHEARYLPGAVMPLQHHWHAARQKWGQEGVDTLLTYDMRSLGHMGCMTARGWDAIHHPGSANISLKLFSIANVGRAATRLKSLNAVNEDGFMISDSLKELSDMMDVRAALQNLFRAAQLAAPWNFFFLVIDSFLK
jgi:hypothetical protein